MTQSVNPELDLTISRVIKAPRSAIWRAWTDPARESARTVRTEAAIQPDDRRIGLDIVTTLTGSVHFRS